ncbi:MAG: hypothetical protein AXA67_11195 [Methylothermaceae bacteria B42]|nr:MAG: hypothetical protein AXA67_11195 [Methylothermaceae bacteria B42]HHJ39098.1 Uma2 family endonuclease [Methylothermaceae bacterium]
MQPALDNQTRYTYRDYLTWPEDVRYELIDGKAYLMAPAPTLDHQDIAGEIYRQLGNQLAGKPCRPYIAPVDVLLPKQDEANEQVDTIVQPDVLVVCDQSKLERRGVRGAPDFVVEVLSPSTAYHDHQRKREVYERAGVKEYWLVDPVERMILVYRLDNQGRYGKPEVKEMTGETPISILPEVSIQWDSLVERLPPPED